MPNMTEAVVFDQFARIVAKSLRIDVSQIAFDTHLTDLGAESLALIEITMETETREWVREYYDREYGSQVEAPVSAAAVK